MSKIAVVCPICHLKFYIAAELCGFDQVHCVKTGGHLISFKVDESNADRKKDGRDRIKSGLYRNRS